MRERVLLDIYIRVYVFVFLKKKYNKYVLEYNLKNCVLIRF